MFFALAGVHLRLIATEGDFRMGTVIIIIIVILILLASIGKASSNTNKQVRKSARKKELVGMREVWYWQKQDEELYGAGTQIDAGKAACCCGGCLLAPFVPNPVGKVKDPKQCPNRIF